jgi:hypothetical protein
LDRFSKKEVLRGTSFNVGSIWCVVIEIKMYSSVFFIDMYLLYTIFFSQWQSSSRSEAQKALNRFSKKEVLRETDFNIGTIRRRDIELEEM